MRKREVLPEILDHLPADDSEALRSRRDLKRINALMGNESWICRTIRHFPEAAARGIVELGAGEGLLAARMAGVFPASPITAYDLAPPPPSLPPSVQWRMGDLFASPPPKDGGILVANLFLHHFEKEALRDLGAWCAGFDVIIYNEPDRAVFPHFLGSLMHPFINRVTRHDMHVSICAGFTLGELPPLLGLQAPHWQIRETSTWRGSRRGVAWRR